MRAFPKNRKRLYILIALLLALSPLAVLRLRKLHTKAYAWTMSFGRGCGFTIYNDDYFKLSPLLQEAVKVHERVHLEDGTWQFWREAEAERKAYAVEIEFEERSYRYFAMRYATTHDPNHARASRLFHEFQKEAMAMRDSYNE